MMNKEQHPDSRWSIKRVIVLLFTLILAALGLYTWQRGVGNRHEMYLLCVGAVLGLFYVSRGGSLPTVVYRRMRINAEDDPRNLPPKLYLSVLLIVVIAAAAVYYFFGPSR